MAHYTDESNILLLISLLKAHGISRIVASPGSTNMSFVRSIQEDSYFRIYSCVDERSAAYIACGMAEESGEPVVISCTGATASRNYLSALTEAFYRKIPILAVTSTRHVGQLGQNIPQTIDRTHLQKDIVKKSYLIPSFTSDQDKRIYTTLINDAILELTHRSKGPVHINLATTYSENYSNTSLPQVRIIKRIMSTDVFVPISEKRLGILVGAHSKWTRSLTQTVEQFCDKYGAVVFCDRTSNYFGRHRINPAIVLGQKEYKSPCASLDLLITIGEISGAYYKFKANKSWRVHSDGEVRDTYGNLEYVFECNEELFFRRYLSEGKSINEDRSYEKEWLSEIDKIQLNCEELPFSNIWAAQMILPRLPKESELHLGILSSLRSWNFFNSTENINCYCNTGGFGIDGCVSSLVGASLEDSNKLYFGVFGDLSFFYDMNVLGNRHIGNNLRIIIVNNGRGQEFCNFAHPGSRLNGLEREFVAAEGHFGCKSPDLLRHYSIDLGFEYLCASSKDELSGIVEYFCSSKMQDRSIVLELFTDGEDESKALELVYTAYHEYRSVNNILRATLGTKALNKIINKIK